MSSGVTGFGRDIPHPSENYALSFRGLPKMRLV